MKILKLISLLPVLFLVSTFQLHAIEAESVPCQKDKLTGIVSCDDGTVVKLKIETAKKNKKKPGPPVGLDGQPGKVRELDDDEAEGKMKSFNPKFIKRKKEK